MNLESIQMVSTKPPLPPRKSQTKPEKPLKDCPTKRKNFAENIQKMQKLTATNDRLNGEINDLRRLLQNEKLAVRELR